jgi:hypothetical protein
MKSILFLTEFTAAGALIFISAGAAALGIGAFRVRSVPWLNRSWFPLRQLA